MIDDEGGDVVGTAVREVNLSLHHRSLFVLCWVRVYLSYISFIFIFVANSSHIFLVMYGYDILSAYTCSFVCHRFAKGNVLFYNH